MKFFSCKHLSLRHASVNLEIVIIDFNIDETIGRSRKTANTHSCLAGVNLRVGKLAENRSILLNFILKKLIVENFAKSKSSFSFFCILRIKERGKKKEISILETPTALKVSTDM